MGGRGAKSGLETQTEKRKGGSIKDLLNNMKKLDNYDLEKREKEELQKKLPVYGEKVQQAYIDYVKKQTDIDLTPARDTYFDNRKGFNIDTRALKPWQLSEIKKLSQKYPAGYEVEFYQNGATRVLIRVKRKKK